MADVNSNPPPGDRTPQAPIFTIQTDATVGSSLERRTSHCRYLAAARDIKPGEVILKEAPLIVGPRLEGAPVCMSCFRFIATPHTCTQCHLAELCSPECETNPNHAGKECELLAEAVLSLEDFQYLTSNYEWLLPFRIMVNIKHNTQQREPWEKFLQLEAHMEKRRNTWIWESHRNTIIQGLQNVGLIGKDEQEEELAQKVCGILDVNSFEIRSPEQELLRGIFLEASMMCHDCIGNTHLAVDKDYVMTVRASLPIAKGDKIMFNYTGPLQGTECRRDILRKGKYFECNCVRCDDPSELGTYLSALRCPKCRKGYILNEKEEWKCQDCGKKFNTKMIQTVLDVAQDYVEDGSKVEQHALESLLNRLNTTFHTNHFLMLELKQRLLSIYRDMILLGNNMSSRILQRDIELCQELLPVIETVEPGLSRLRGITLYTLHLPVVLLAQKELQCSNSDHIGFLSKLEEAEALLKEALALLIYEPPKTPEGMLAVEAKEALKCLRETIMDVKDQVVTSHMRSIQ
uniref:Protein msta, isoform A n=1 Tax=Cacopsylla melanoneura TaxID=428564 RepID=A0A8D8XRP4_9HEMI